MTNTTSNPKLSPDQIQCVKDFLHCLFEDDVKSYWNKISRIDQARVFGMYKAMLDLDLSATITFDDYVDKEFKKYQEELYIKLKKNSGFSSTHRYTRAGDVMVYAFENIRGSVTYIGKSLTNVFPIILTLDARYKNNQLSGEWRVRLYEDYWFESLDENDWVKSLGDEALQDFLNEPADD